MTQDPSKSVTAAPTGSTPVPDVFPLVKMGGPDNPDSAAAMLTAMWWI